MKYQQLSQDYIDDTIAEALYQREIEHFHYIFDLENFEFLVKITDDAGFKQNLSDRIASVKVEMQKVEEIYSALESRITDKARHQLAIERTAKKRLEKAP